MHGGAGSGIVSAMIVIISAKCINNNQITPEIFFMLKCRWWCEVVVDNDFRGGPLPQTLAGVPKGVES